MSLVSMLAELKVNTYFIGTVYCRYYISKEVLLIQIFLPDPDPPLLLLYIFQ